MKFFVWVSWFSVLWCQTELSRDVCWRRSYGNGFGSIPSVCPDDLEHDGLLCYPKCKQGYYGIGPVCWEKCPSGYSDTGAFCQIWPHIYGKGCCCTVFSKSCCSNCRPAYTDDGCTCRKSGHTKVKLSYGRGVGFVKTKTCSNTMIKSAGLCYSPCSPNYDSVGPFCLKQCSGLFGITCNGVFCSTSQDACYQFILLQAFNKSDSNITLCNWACQITSGHAKHICVLHLCFAWFLINNFFPFAFPHSEFFFFLYKKLESAYTFEFLSNTRKP